VRLWEEGKQEEASAEKHRYEQNQRKRKSELKNLLKDKDFTGDDYLYYQPKYFDRSTHPITGEEFYVLKEKEGQHNYWLDREKGDWAHMPKIFEDDCEAFYE